MESIYSLKKKIYIFFFEICEIYELKLIILAMSWFLVIDLDALEQTVFK